MKKYSVYFLFILTIALFSGCTPSGTVEEFDEERFGFDYFPLEVGKFWIYAVDSIVYDDLGATKLDLKSEIKEEIVDTFRNEVNELVYVVNRFWRRENSSPWQVTDVWSAVKDRERAFRTEDNLKFIKFVFPPLTGKRWNSNIYFDEFTIVTIAGESLRMFADWNDAQMTSVDVNERIGSVDYENVATILLTDDDERNAIERRYALEKYARGVGLVYKEYIILDTQCSSCQTSWEEKAEKGFILKQTLLEYN